MTNIELPVHQGNNSIFILWKVITQEFRTESHVFQ